MIVLENITKEFGERTLFRGINYQFPLGERIALVGPNGRGKTTLLRIIIGEEEASLGRVVMPKDFEMGYLPQEPNPKPRESVLEECLSGAKKISELRDKIQYLLVEMQERPKDSHAQLYSDVEAQFSTLGGYGIESEAMEILHGLGFRDDQIANSPLQLSGGWRMRLELAKIFLNRPQFLLLDEPTNHLDLPSLVWVEDFLHNYEGTLIFVSHDRPLLNRLSTVILELSAMGLHSYKGNFDDYLQQKELRAAQLQSERDQILRRQKELSDFITRFGAKASKATQAQSRVKMLARLRAEEQGIPVEEAQKSISIRLPEPSKSARMVLSVENLTVGYPGVKLAKDVTLKIERGMKVAVIGANGIGKSTLLKTLRGTLPKLAGEIKIGDNVHLSFFAQDQLDVLDEEASILENVLLANSQVGEPMARSLLGSLLFRGPDVFKKVKVLSGGEKSRVGLAKVLLENANFLLLDEPTNHLDMASVEILSQALGSYSGTLIFVSHDREFIDNVCTHVFVMLADGRSQLFEGKLEDYQRLCIGCNFPDILQLETSKPKKANLGTDTSVPVRANLGTDTSVPVRGQRCPSPNSSKKDMNKKIAKLEKEMETLREQIDAFDGQIAQCHPGNYSELTKLSQSRDALSAKLEEQENLWLELNS